MQMTISDLSKEYGVSRHAILFPIHKGRLKAKKQCGSTGHWVINKSDFEEYRKGRYKRNNSIVNGQPLYDKNDGIYSVVEASEIIGCPAQQIYYHLRVGIIPSKRMKSNWLIHIDDINKYKSDVSNRRVKKYRKRLLRSDV